MERIKVLLVEPGNKPRLVEIDHTLEELQRLVNDDIQAIYPYDDPVALVCGDNGKCKGFVANRILEDDNGDPYDIICGTFFICGLGSDDFASISDELAEKYTRKFYWPEVFARFGDHVIWFKDKPGARPQVLF